MNSEDVRKMFEKDSRDKKRIGANAHKMAGKGKRGGLKYGVLLGKSVFDKPYTKNTKTITSNLKKEICSYEKLISFTEAQQKEIIEQWLNTFSFNKISTELGISRTKLSKIFSDLNINKKSYYQDDKKGISMEDFNVEDFSENNFNKNKFYKLDDMDKFEVIENLKRVEKLSNKDIAELLDVKASSVSVYISKWKKEYQRFKTGGLRTDPGIINDKLDDVDSFKTETLTLDEDLPIDLDEVPERNIPVFNYNIKGLYDGKELAQELIEIANEVKDYSSIDVHVKIKK